jgi:hypothetical protein
MKSIIKKLIPVIVICFVMSLVPAPAWHRDACAAASPVGDIITKGPWVDVRAYAGGLTEAATAADTAGKLIVVTNPQTLTGNTTVSSDRGLVVMVGGSINRATYTLTINGSFSGTPGCFLGTGSVVFGSSLTASITWYPLHMDGATDDSDHIQEAIASLPAGSTLEFPYTGTGYYTEAAVTAKTGVSLEAKGHVTWTIKPSGSILNIITLNQATNYAIKGFRFYSNGTKTSKIYALHETTSNSDVLFEDLWFEGVSFGIKLDTVNCVNNTIRNIKFKDAASVVTGSGAIFTNGYNTVIDTVYGEDIGGTHLDHLIYAGPNNAYTKARNIHMLNGAGYLLANGSVSIPVEISDSVSITSYGGVAGWVIGTNLLTYEQNQASGTAYYLQNGAVLSNSQVIGHQGMAISLEDNCMVNGLKVKATATGHGLGGQLAGATGQRTIIANSVFEGTGTAGTTQATYFTVASSKNHARWANNVFWNVATDTAISDASDDSQYIDNYFYSSDATVFHTAALIDATGTRFRITDNSARYASGTPSAIWKTSGMTDGEANLSYLERNISNVDQMPTIASATDMRIDSTMYAAYISGTTDIQTINGTVTKHGTVLTLIFSGTLNLKHLGGAGSYRLIMKSGADTATAAGKIFRFMWTGLYWYEL